MSTHHSKIYSKRLLARAQYNPVIEVIRMDLRVTHKGDAYKSANIKWKYHESDYTAYRKRPKVKTKCAAWDQTKQV